MCALSADHDRVPSIDSPLDAVGAVDAALTAGGAVGLLTHVVGLLAGAVGTATFGVLLGVVCVLRALLVRSLQGLPREAEAPRG